MKVFAKVLSLSAIVAVVAGCASDDVVYVPKLPQAAQAKMLDYLNQPDNKVFVIAIDPGGDFAFGYDYGKPTLKEAAQIAVDKCNANRESHAIVAKAYIYAINDKVVYEDMIRKDAQAKRDAGEKAQINEADRQDKTGEVTQPAE